MAVGRSLIFWIDVKPMILKNRDKQTDVSGFVSYPDCSMSKLAS